MTQQMMLVVYLCVNHLSHVIIQYLRVLMKSQKKKLVL